MNAIYLAVATAVAMLAGGVTLAVLFSRAHRLGAEDLSDEDRSLAWRTVIFVIFPLVTFLGLRATIVAAGWAGGYVREWAYGVLWYYALPAGITGQAHLVDVLYAGIAAQVLFALCLVPALFFRPHPFLSTVVGYTVVFVLGVNLVVQPAFAFLGPGVSLWRLAFDAAGPPEKVAIALVSIACALLFAAVIACPHTRFWFSALSRPLAAEDLRFALAEACANPASPYLACRLGILYVRAGLFGQAKACLRNLEIMFPGSVYCLYFRALLRWHQRNYGEACQAFQATAASLHLDVGLQAQLLAASACSAFAGGKLEKAQDLSEQALELDANTLVASMVKIDVFLRTGRKELAAEEIARMRGGFEPEEEPALPLDGALILQRIMRCQTRAERHQTVR